MSYRSTLLTNTVYSNQCHGVFTFSDSILHAQCRRSKSLGWQGGGQPSAFLKFFLTCPGGETLSMSGGLRRTRSRTTVFYLLRFQLLHFIAVGRTGLSTQVSRDMWLYVKTLLYPGSKGCGRPALTSGTMLSAHQPLQTPHFLCIHLVALCLCTMAMKCSRVQPSGFGVTAVGVLQSMTRNPPIHQRHLPAAVGTTVSENTPFLCVHLVALCLCVMVMKCSRVRPSGLT